MGEARLVRILALVQPLRGSYARCASASATKHGLGVGREKAYDDEVGGGRIGANAVGHGLGVGDKEISRLILRTVVDAEAEDDKAVSAYVYRADLSGNASLCISSRRYIV